MRNRHLRTLWKLEVGLPEKDSSLVQFQCHFLPQKPQILIQAEVPVVFYFPLPFALEILVPVLMRYMFDNKSLLTTFLYVLSCFAEAFLLLRFSSLAYAFSYEKSNSYAGIGSSWGSWYSAR